MENKNKKEGLISSYIHSNGRIGALVEVVTETDFAARTELFQLLARDLAMQVAAMGEKDVLNQSFVKNPEITVKSHLEWAEKELGEKIRLGRMARYVL